MMPTEWSLHKNLMGGLRKKNPWGTVLESFSAGDHIGMLFLLYHKEIQPVHSEGDQPRDLFGRNEAKAETPVLWPPHAKSWLIGKDSDAGRDWGQEEKGTTEDEMAVWYHWLDGHESQWTPGVGDGQGGLACCDSWGRKESDTTERLIWSELILLFLWYASFPLFLTPIVSIFKIYWELPYVFGLKVTVKMSYCFWRRHSNKFFQGYSLPPLKFNPFLHSYSSNRIKTTKVMNLEGGDTLSLCRYLVSLKTFAN